MSCGVCCAQSQEELIQVAPLSDYSQERAPESFLAAPTASRDEPGRFIEEEEPVAAIAREELEPLPAPPKPESMEAKPLPEPAPPQAEAPDQDAYVFQTQIVKTPGRGLGLDLSPHDGESLLVGRVKEGAVADWNATRPADACDLVVPGDRIVVVNGKEANAEELLVRMRADSVLNMTIRRKLLITVRVRRMPGDILGIELVEAAEGCVIESISSGSAADKANRAHVSELTLRPGDRIVQANASTEAKEIREEMRSGKNLELKIRRANSKPHNDDIVR